VYIPVRVSMKITLLLGRMNELFLLSVGIAGAALAAIKFGESLNTSKPPTILFEKDFVAVTTYSIALFTGVVLA
jgi:hypothetical protein